MYVRVTYTMLSWAGTGAGAAATRPAKTAMAVVVNFILDDGVGLVGYVDLWY